MLRFFRRHRALVLVSIALVIGGMILVDLGRSAFSTSPFDTAFKVNGQRISVSEYNQTLQRLSRSMPPETPPHELAGRTMNQLIQQTVFAQEARNYGITVSDSELQLQLAAIPAFQKEGHFDPGQYQATLRQAGLTVPEFEKMQRRDSATQRLYQLIALAVHVTDDEARAQQQVLLSAEKDPAKKKDIADVENVREELRKKELDSIYNAWVAKINTTLKVTPPIKVIQDQLTQPAPPVAAQ